MHKIASNTQKNF